jgi:tetratricopeptide (TPR) repeat protein
MDCTTRAASSILNERRVRIGTLAVLVFGCATSGPTGPAQVERRDEAGFTIEEEIRVGLGVRGDFEKAVELLQQERYEEGIARLVEITAREPALALAHLNLGIAYRRTDELTKAQSSLEKALALSPGHPAVLNELGIVHRRNGRFEEARRSYEAALERVPEFHFARRNLAILCDLYLADETCALENYEVYLDALPGDEQATIWVADLKNRVGR